MDHEIRRGDLLIVKRLMLIPKNENYQPITVIAKDDFETFAVVVGILLNFKNLLKKFYS